MVNVVLVSNIVEKNGKTIRENNLEVHHTIPLGTLVEVNCDYQPEHRTRQFIAAHGRDCDGSPLYSLTTRRNLCDDQIATDEYGETRTAEYIEYYRRLHHNGCWGGDALIVISDHDTGQ